MRRRCRMSPAGDPTRLPLFLDGDDGLGMFQPAQEPGILPFGLRQFRRHRIAHRGLGSSFDGGLCTERASVAQPAPFAQGRRIQTFPAQDGAGAASGGAVDLRQNPQLVLHREGPTPRPIRQFGSRRRRGWHSGRPPAFRRASPCGITQLRVFVRHNHAISVLRPEAKLFGLRCLMIIGTEGPLAKGESLHDRIDVELQQIQENRALVRSFFRAETVSYISD